ncbi:MAG TPA: FAD-dependent oxidoreductase [Steroidobacteraceae bacterium]
MLVVGAGIAGLSTALEAGNGGAKVTVIDMASVFGGHAVMSEGDVTIIDTPFQRERGTRDTPDLAYKEFVEWGEDVNTEWVHYYVDHSRADIYDWLTGMGVVFEGLRKYPGNTVPRAHITRGRGLGLVMPLYRACLESPNITFVWNTKVVELLMERGRVTGLEAQDLRQGTVRDFRARAIVLATGGFQSNLELVRRHWPSDVPVPPRLLAGSGIHSMGFGLELATKAGAALTSLDHQWNYERGLPDPRYPGMNRGLNAVVQGVRVNALGKPFMPPSDSGKVTLPALLAQPDATYWTVFDEKSKRTFWISGSDWADFDRIQRLILDNRDIVKQAPSLEELAAQIGLPAAALRETISEYNSGPTKINTPPFYAAQFFPLTRKSMGGIAIDSEARVLDEKKRPIPRLYAAGEVTGEAGINGKAALEGTFLGSGVVTGRVAARAILRDLHISRNTGHEPVPPSDAQTAPPPNAPPAASCTSCHDLPSLLGQKREGFWHFEQVHGVVLEHHYECAVCHGDMGAPLTPRHHSNPLAQIKRCGLCHVAQ